MEGDFAIEHARYLLLSLGVFASQSTTRVFTNDRKQISCCMLEHAVGPNLNAMFVIANFLARIVHEGTTRVEMQ